MIKVKVPSNFMKQVKLIRNKEGSYVDGKWVENSKPSEHLIRASVQPLQPTNYRILKEGDSPFKYKQVYTNINLVMPSKKTVPDKIIDGEDTLIMTDFSDWGGNGYTDGIFKKIE